LIEGEFRDLLSKLEPSPGLFRAAALRFEDLWKARIAEGAALRRELKAEIAQIEKSVGQFLNRIVGADVESVVAVYQNKIRQLEEEKIVRTEKLDACGKPTSDFHSALRTAPGLSRKSL